MWNAILRAPGYPTSFATWALSWPEIAYLPRELPDADLLCTIQQLAKHDANDVVMLELRARCAARKYEQFLDETQAYCSKHIRKFRGPPKPMVHCITKSTTLQVTRLRIRRKGILPLRIHNPDDFDPGCTVYLRNSPVPARLVAPTVLELQNHRD